jgi:hypothetical protein
MDLTKLNLTHLLHKPTREVPMHPLLFAPMNKALLESPEWNRLMKRSDSNIADADWQTSFYRNTWAPLWWNEGTLDTSSANFEMWAAHVNAFLAPLDGVPQVQFVYRTASPFAGVWVAACLGWLKSKNKALPDPGEGRFSVVYDFTPSLVEAKKDLIRKAVFEWAGLDINDTKLFVEIMAAAKDFRATQVGGNAWTGQSCFESMLHEVTRTNSPKMESIRAFRNARASAGDFFIGDTFAVVSDKPTEIHIGLSPQASDLAKETGLPFGAAPILINDKGATMRYPDGYGLFHLEGLNVPSVCVEDPGSLTKEMILEEPNMEIQRIMRGIYGEGRFLEETGAVVLDVDYEGATIGACPRALFKDTQGNHILMGTDGSTGRCYHMYVSTEANTCVEAHESICGIPDAAIKYKS